MAVSGIGPSSTTLAGAASAGHHKHGHHRGASISDVGAQSTDPVSTGRPAGSAGGKIDIKA